MSEATRRPHPAWSRWIPRPGALPLALMAAGLMACGGAGETPSPSPSGDVPTFYEDVAPILNAQCVQCHQFGGVAPFALDSFQSAAQWADAIADSTESRRMPPWYVVNDGTCGDFTTPWLSDAEIETLGDWARGGAPEGDVASDPGPADPPTSLGAEATVFEMPESYTPVITGNPGEEKDDYRCFLMTPTLPEDAFITALEAVPGNLTIVHHILAYSVDLDQEVGDNEDGSPKTNGQVIEALSAKDGRPGWGCYGVAGDGVLVNGLIASWAPGSGVVELPEGTGVSLRGGDRVIMQVHYNLDNGAGSDRTQLKYRLASSVASEAFVVLPDGLLETLSSGDPFILEPGKADIPFTWTGTVSELSDYLTEYYPDRFPTRPAGYNLYGVFPHMHARGSGFEAELTPSGGGAPQCLAKMDRWDFNWQHLYPFTEPVFIDDQHEVTITCHYNTQGAIQPVVPGVNSTDEMCMLGLYFTVVE